MSRGTDFLRSLGMPDEHITKMQAELDQCTAEADHLIDHARRLHAGTVEGALVEGLAIRGHIDANDADQQRRLLAALISRAGQLAAAVEELSIQKTALEAALAAAQEGTE